MVPGDRPVGQDDVGMGASPDRRRTRVEDERATRVGAGGDVERPRSIGDVERWRHQGRCRADDDLVAREQVELAQRVIGVSDMSAAHQTQQCLAGIDGVAEMVTDRDDQLTDPVLWIDRGHDVAMAGIDEISQYLVVLRLDATQISVRILNSQEQFWHAFDRTDRDRATEWENSPRMRRAETRYQRYSVRPFGGSAARPVRFHHAPVDAEVARTQARTGGRPRRLSADRAASRCDAVRLPHSSGAPTR